MAADVPVDRLVLGAASLADESAFVALSDLAALVGEGSSVEYRLIGGIMVSLHAQRWRLGPLLYRQTQDADLGVPPAVVRDTGILARLEDLGYEKVAGNRFERQLDPPASSAEAEGGERVAAIDVLVPAYTSRARDNVRVGELQTTEVRGLALALNRPPVRASLEMVMLDGETTLTADVLLPDEQSALVLRAYAWHVRAEGKDAVDLWRALEIASAAGVTLEGNPRGRRGAGIGAHPRGVPVPRHSRRRFGEDARPLFAGTDSDEDAAEGPRDEGCGGRLRDDAGQRRGLRVSGRNRSQWWSSHSPVTSSRRRREMRTGVVAKRCSCGSFWRNGGQRCRRCGSSKFASWGFYVDTHPHSATERRKTVRSGFPTKDAAERELLRLLGAVQAGNFTPRSKWTLASYLGVWLDGRTHLRPTTRDTYGILIERYICNSDYGIGTAPMWSLTRPGIRHFYAELERRGRLRGDRPLHPKAVHNVHLVLRKALEDAVEDGLIPANPARRAHMLSVRRPEMKTWTEAQVAAFLGFVRDDPLYSLWRTAATTGMRRGELLAVTWPALDLAARRLHVTKALGRGPKGEPPRFGPPKTDRGRRAIPRSRDGEGPGGASSPRAPRARPEQ